MSSLRASIPLFLFFCFVSTALAVGKAGDVPVPSPSATIDLGTLVSLAANPTIRGSASSTAFVHIWITRSAGGVVYETDTPVSGNRWYVDVPSLQNGTYHISISAAPPKLVSLPLATSSLTVGLSSLPQIEPGLLPPYDVADGKLMRFVVKAKGASSVALDKLTFGFDTTAASVDSLALYAFTDADFTQPATGTDGLVAQASIDSLVPAGLIFDAPLQVPAGHTYYFELDGAVTPTDSVYSVTTTLLGDAPSAVILNAPALISTSNFVWSPSTYGTASTSDADWLNGSLALGLPQAGLSQGRSGAPSPPTCTITADSSVITANQPFTLQWSSTRADSATWENGTPEVLQGTKSIKNLTTPRTYTLVVYGVGGSDTCSVAVALAPTVQAPPLPPPPPTNPATTTQATTTPVLGYFTATPITGAVSLAVKFTGTVNATKSCAAATYYFGYGDGATSTVVVAKNVCKAQSFIFTHTYTKVGAFTAALYNGPGTTSAQLIQKQTITVKAKTAFSDVFSNAASVWYAVMPWLKFLHAPFRFGAVGWHTWQP